MIIPAIKKENAPTKSNATLWEQFDEDQLIYDLTNLTTKQLKERYNTTAVRIYVACNHYGIDSEPLKAVGNKIYSIPNKEDLEVQLRNGKRSVARLHGCTIPVVNRWISSLGISIEPHQGKLIDLAERDLAQYINNGLTARQIRILTGFSVAQINRQAKRFGLHIRKTSDNWADLQQILSNKFDWICNENKTRDILDISQELQITHSTVLKFIKEKGHVVISHSYNKSKGEKELKDFVTSLGLDCKSVKLNYNGLSREIDCYIEHLNIGIEYCGEYWHSDLHKDKNYHKDKLNWCFDQGINLITIFANEWNSKPELIKSMLAQRLGKISQRMFARKLKVIEILNTVANEFYDTNHIQGRLANISKSLALIDSDNTIVSVMSFTKSRFNKDYQWEIGRFATIKNTIVVGGASKLFNVFIETNRPINCISFCDLRYGSGKVYEHMGFEFQKTTTPGYFYYHKTTDQSFSRFKFQKHKLSKELTRFDPSLSEYDNMILNNYVRVWDCGNNVFSWHSLNNE